MSCEPWDDMVLGTGARVDAPPHLTVFAGEVMVSWQTTAGIVGAVVNARGQVRRHLDLGHPNAKDPYLFRRALNLEAFFTEPVGARSYIRRITIDEGEGSIDLGEVGPTRIAVEAAPGGGMMIVAVSPTVSTLHELRGMTLQSWVPLDPSWSVPPVLEPYPPFSMGMGGATASWPPGTKRASLSRRSTSGAAVAGS